MQVDGTDGRGATILIVGQLEGWPADQCGLDGASIAHAATSDEALRLIRCAQPDIIVVSVGQLGDEESVELLHRSIELAPASVRIFASPRAPLAEAAINRAHVDFWLALPTEAATAQDLLGRALEYRATRTDRELLLDTTMRQYLLLLAISQSQDRFLAGTSARDSFASLLEGALAITESELGLVGEVRYELDGTPYLRILALSTGAWTKSPERDVTESPELRDLQSLLGKVLTERTPVTAAEPATELLRTGLPAGHPPLRSFAAIPLMSRDRVIGVIALANRPAAYAPLLLEEIAPFLRTGAVLVERYHVEQQRSETERNLAHEERRLRAVFDASVDGLVIVDAVGTIRRANPALARIFGYSISELLGESVEMLMPTHLARRHAARMPFYEPGAPSTVVGHISELEGKRKDGGLFPVEISVVAINDPTKAASYVGTLRDISGRKRQERDLVSAQRALESANRELAKMARTDPLTLLANRRHFNEAVNAEIRRCRRSGGRFALLLCDVDHFKRFNDTDGHAAGDSCLCKLAEIFRDHFRRGPDLPARWGGEEFAVLIPEVAEPSNAVELAEKLRQRVFEEGIPHPDSPVAACVTISIGVALTTPAESTTPEQVFAVADRALYAAKSEGRNKVVFGGAAL